MGLNNSASMFLLTGFPGMEKAHHWISIPLLIVYLSILLGNGLLLFVIKDDHNLHEPMYYFLAMLAAADLGVTVITMPTVFSVFWLNHREIIHETCFAQAYFIHTINLAESGILLAMAYDRFVAIRNPLRYSSILTNVKVMKIGLGVWTRAGLIIMPPILRLHWFPYCQSQVLSHTFCLHQDIIRLACADITFNRLYPVVLIFGMFLLDFFIIVLTYILIFKTVTGIASREERSKALTTCASHIGCILVFYVTFAILAFLPRFAKNAPPLINISMSYVYLLFPPFVNPVIYSIKTKQIQNGIIRLFSLSNSRT
ncbi:olfactory receptor 51B6-like [Sorex araneus]|uniref:olfactory receptor 51B6-like n=1 Tax=Sorex araneus TaxID=42254 RepID=UPI002433879B|nr:olfactory receptor 51B6-like [Sorex araneus]